MLLRTDKLSKAFGGLLAVAELDLAIAPGELVGLIGPNGAGKTTVFNLITGLTPVSAGRIFFAGQEITGLKPHQITALGIARTFQNIRLFKELSVFDNVRIACHLHTRYGLVEGFTHLGRFADEERQLAEKARHLLALFGLEDMAGIPAGSLPYGAQRRLEIARALATEPRLLLLDEPAAGMNPHETTELMRTIAWLRDEFKLTVLLIEHDMRLVMGICERIYVLDYGQLIAEGTPAEIRTNRRVIEAYLGEEVS